MTDHPRRYGVLMPHFGSAATRERFLAAARAIEGYGFDSAWFRDHVVYGPNPYEEPDPTFLETFASMAAVAAITDRITLGTASIIPHRHPLQLSLALGTVERIAGDGRLIVGIGLGGFDREFDAVGMTGWDRERVVREQVAILRRLWEGAGPVDFDGEFYHFDRIAQRPIPAADTPIWYCGASLAGARRAAEYDGYMLGKTPRSNLRRYLARLRETSDALGREMPVIGLEPVVSPGRTRAAALAPFDVPMFIHDMNKRYGRPTPLTSFEDLDGSLMAGPPAEIAGEVERYHDLGVSHIVFNMRNRAADWEDALGMLGEEVLPLLRTGPDGAVA